MSDRYRSPRRPVNGKTSLRYHFVMCFPFTFFRRKHTKKQDERSESVSVVGISAERKSSLCIQLDQSSLSITHTTRTSIWSVVYVIHFYVLSRSALSVILIPGIVLLISQTRSHAGHLLCWYFFKPQPVNLSLTDHCVLTQRTGRSLTPTIVLDLFAKDPAL